MRKVQYLLILAALELLLWGCHRKDGAGPAKESPSSATVARELASHQEGEGAPAIPSVRHDRALIVCFGDSLTAGYGAPQGQSYPDYLQADLDQLRYRYRVVNEGVSGNTTKDGLARLPDVLAMNPRIVVLEFGGNDGLRGLPISESRANLDAMVKALKAAGVQVAIAGITLPPNYGPDYIREFDETYAMLSKKYRVPMLPFLLDHVYGVPGMMQQDETHATGKGNAVVARNVLKLIRPLLNR